jgi:hypothetical protein
MQLAHAQENALVLLQAEIFGSEKAGCLQKGGIVAHDGAQDEAFGVQVSREWAVDSNVADCHE